MSSYATLAHLAQFGVPSSALSGISPDAQQAALDAASTRADGYLKNHFKLPITTPSIDLVEAICRIAAYNLLSVRGYNPETGGDTNLRDRFLDAVKWLEGVARGSITPDLQDSSPGGVLGGPYVVQSQLSDSGGASVIVAGSPRARGW